jgi:hypothetical protein
MCRIVERSHVAAVAKQIPFPGALRVGCPSHSGRTALTPTASKHSGWNTSGRPDRDEDAGRTRQASADMDSLQGPRPASTGTAHAAARAPLKPTRQLRSSTSFSFSIQSNYPPVTARCFWPQFCWHSPGPVAAPADRATITASRCERRTPRGSAVRDTPCRTGITAAAGLSKAGDQRRQSSEAAPQTLEAPPR